MEIFQNETFQNLIEEGMCELEFLTKAYIYNSNEELFNLLDFENRDIFLNPLVIYIVKNDLKHLLPQILYGFINPKEIKNVIEVHSDEDGIVYVTGLGYFITELSNAKLDLTFLNESINLRIDNNPVKYKYEKPYFIENSTIEIIKYKLSYFKNSCIDLEEKNCFSEVRAAILSPTLITIYENAIAFYRDVYKEIKIFQIGKCIFPFVHDYLRSFSDFNLNGVAFTNIKVCNTKVGIAGDLSHQWGHSLIDFIFLHPEKIIKIDASTIMRTLSQQDDKRTILDAIHGFFVIYFEFLSFSKMLNCSFYEDSHNEIIARLNFYNFSHNGLGFFNIDCENVFTPLGLNIFKTLQGDMVVAYQNFKEILIP